MPDDFKNSNNINLRMRSKSDTQQKEIVDKEMLEKKVKQSFFSLLWTELKQPLKILCKTIISTAISTFIFSLILYLFWNEVLIDIFQINTITYVQSLIVWIFFQLLRSGSSNNNSNMQNKN